ncbi:MAG: NAD(P)H-dependent oxidoreductase [Clostridia bacterium]|nr:NAD(P)H-dependent oxidoreductase [Clostridia bacterium]
MSKIKNVLVVNGSPKGKNSITLQTSRYLELLFPDLTFDTLHVGAQIKALEKDMTPAIEKLKGADLIVFSYPVYTFIAPYQLHRFIELLKECNVDLSDKYATQISTSKHFYDWTAHRYVEDNALDLNLKYIKGLSADMDDLTTKKGQKEAVDFWNYVLYAVENDILVRNTLDYSTPNKVSVIPNTVTETRDNGDIVILTNAEENDNQLHDMIAYFSSVMPRKTRVINIREYPFKGGCLGCFNCASTGKCIYKDNFDSFLREEIQTAEAIVMAFTIKDHSMGASFKLYDDRQFCNGHRTVTMGMPMGYIVSGNLSKEENLKVIIEGRANVGGNFLAGVATDEFEPNKELDALAKSLEYALENQYVPPQNFLGIGGMKIFRDLIWQMQGLMRADHKFYKAHGQYDFPQKHRGRMIAMYLVGSLMSNKKLMAKAGNMMNEGMLMPYNKVLEKTKKELDK